MNGKRPIENASVTIRFPPSIVRLDRGKKVAPVKAAIAGKTITAMLNFEIYSGYIQISEIIHPPMTATSFRAAFTDSAMSDQQSLDNQIKNAYSKRANRFFFEVLAIQIASIIVATVVIVAMGTDGLILLAVLSIGVSYLVVTLLFKHVDTLILTRLMQLEEGILSHSTDTDPTAEEVIEGEKSGE